MAFNIYSTHTMLAAVEQMEPVSTFLRDRYFPTAQEDLFPTEDVLVEFRDGTTKMAPVVLPRKGSITVEREGYQTQRMTPPLVAPSRPLTIDDLNKKGFGENLFSNITPQQRQADILGKDLLDFDRMHAKREEYIAAQCMFKNGYILRQYADQYGTEEYQEFELRFYEEAANPAAYTPALLWDAATSNKLGDIAIMVRMLTTRGNAATELILGSDAAEELVMDKTIKELLDISRYNFGAFEPKSLGPEAALLGRLNINGRMIDLITYDGTYIDEVTGKAEPYIPAKSICLTAPGAGRGLYGAVTQLEQQDGEFHTYMGRRVPKYTADADSNIRKLTVSSRPLFIPRTKNPFITATVLA